MIQELNRSILLWFNSFGEYQFIEISAPIMADLPIFFLPLFLIFLWFYYTWKYSKKDGNKQKEVLLYIFYACVVAVIINLSLQQFITLERPESALEWAGKVLLKKLPSASFPSDHAAVSIAFLSSLFFFNYKKVAWYFLGFVILMNISRIVVWVHWPFDILWGVLTGLLSAYITYMFLQKNKLVKTINTFIIKISNTFKL